MYDAQGRETEQTGGADYPVGYTCDATDGWITEMKAYRDTTGNDALNGTEANASPTTRGVACRHFSAPESFRAALFSDEADEL